MNLPDRPNCSCCGPEHFSRRTLLKMAGMAGLTWLTPLGQLLALEAEKSNDPRAKSVIILWLAGGPSQLETFDPHPGSSIAYGTRAIKTSIKDVQLAAGFEHTADILSNMSLIRSVTSLEGDHERATYNIQTGYRPSPSAMNCLIKKSKSRLISPFCQANGQRAAVISVRLMTRSKPVTPQSRFPIFHRGSIQNARNNGLRTLP
jgi:uncharacterized protein (DUF1501 family)